MSDSFYKKQLDAFGIESTLIVEGDIKRKRQEEYTQAMLNVVRMLMNSVEGRQWLYLKLEMCGVFTTPFIAGKGDATAFLCGMQEVGHLLQRDITVASPENYFLMVQEEEARKKNVDQSS